MRRCWPLALTARPGSRAPSPTAWAPTSVGLEDLAAGVVAAVRADVVRAPRLAALRAGRQLDQGQREMGAAAALATLGELYLRQTHERPVVYRVEPGA